MTSALTIGDGRVAVDFDARTGGLLDVRGADSLSWLRSPVGGSLFVVEIPRGGDRTVTIATAEQRLAGSRLADDGRSIELRWSGLVTSVGEHLEGEIVVDASIDDRGVLLRLHLDIPAGGVEAVRFPSVRGIVPPGGGPLDFRGVDYSTGTRVRLLPEFDNNSPYWGTTFPDYASGNLRPEVVGNPTSPVALLAGGSGGLAVLPDAPTLDFIGWRVSLEPGYLDSLARTTDADATVTFDAIQFPLPGAGRRTLSPVRLTPYAGTWESGLAPYRAVQGPTRVSRADWLAEPRSWLQVQLMSTEGEPRYDFDALVSIIEECAASGIGVIQITGWNEGGQDGLVPVHRPAEKLGGEAGLRRALDRARELGVATVLYVKYVWVEKPGPFWDELERWVSRDPNGQPYPNPGPVYHSSRKRYGISTPWYVPLCFGVAELRARFAAEVAELAAWGADGVLADESLYHGRALLCFAEDHGHPPGASTFLWDGDFVEDLRGALPADRRDTFVIAAEGAYDAQFEHYDVSYFRSFSPSHIPLGRQLRPDARIVTALIGFDDRNLANQSLLYGYAMSLEPYNFKGRPGDMPRTVAYARQVDALRARYPEWLWDGPLREDAGIRVLDAEGAPHPLVAVRHALGDDLVAIANYAAEPTELQVTGLEGDHVVVDPEGRREPLSGGRLTLAARSAAVLVPARSLREP